MHTPEEIKKALQDGIDAGKHDATPGNLFRSAWPAAKDYGYHGLLHDIFTTGYLSELPPDGVLVDSNSVVVGGPQYQQPAEQTPTCEQCGEAYSNEHDCTSGDHSYTAHSGRDDEGIM